MTSTEETPVKTVGSMRIRSLGFHIIIYGEWEGITKITIPVNLEREARKRRFLLSNNWLDPVDTASKPFR